MGISMNTTLKSFLICNYILLGAASSCIFLTLSLRLFPSACGFLLIFLHIFTVSAAVAANSMVSSGSSRWFGAHMVSTVLTAIFHGAVAVMIFTKTSEFLGELKSYVREEDGGVILKLGGGLSVVIFCLEWVVLSLAFRFKCYGFVESNGVGMRTGKVQQDDDQLNPWPFHV